MVEDPRRFTTEGWIAALQIFGKYDKDFLPEFGHDVMYGPDKPEATLAGYDDVTEEATYEWSENLRGDAEALQALGWHWSGEHDCWIHY